MFRMESDFEAFERVMVEAHLRQPIRILSCCDQVRAKGIDPSAALCIAARCDSLRLPTHVG
jgi:hypothetical protein